MRKTNQGTRNEPARQQPFRLGLPDGHVLCQLDGPEHAPMILLIHGATVPHWEFDRLVPFLTRAGLQTLRFDLYGHGGSARPRMTYHRDLFVRQAVGVLEALGHAPLRAILGHSMGAAIAADLAQSANPEKLILVAPMLDFSIGNPFRRILQTPLLGEAFMAVIGRPGLIRRRHRRYTAIGQPELSIRFQEQARVAGFWRALLAMERHGALGNQLDAYQQAAASSIEPLIVHGGADHIVSAGDVQTIANCFGQASVCRFPGLEHNLMLTHPGQVAERLVHHLGMQ